MEDNEARHTEPRESVIKHIIQAARLMDEQANMSPDEFVAKYSEGTKKAFVGSFDKAQAQGITPVLICSRNGENSIGPLLQGLSLSTIPLQPIIVDNGSTDRTAEIAQSMGAEVIKEDKPGLPNALRAGFSFFKERGYHGSILHTEEDCVPLPTWAATMTEFAIKQFPNGGHAYGRIVHYDGVKQLIKNGLLTLGNAAKNVLAERKGQTRIHGRNGIVITGDDEQLLEQLSQFPEATAERSIDGAMYDADIAAGKPQATCTERQAIVLTSGRRHENIRSAVKAAILPSRYNRQTYTERRDEKSQNST